MTRMLPILLVLTMNLNTEVLAGRETVRLVNGNGRCSGRVEVSYRDHWGTVCEYNWSMQNAQVVCRELDCGEAVAVLGGAYFEKGTVLIWQERMMCKGNENSVSQCRDRMIGSYCSHDNDVGVQCSGVSKKDLSYPDSSSSKHLHAPRWAVALAVMVVLLSLVVFGICLFFHRRHRIQKLETVHRVCESNVYSVI